MSEASTLVGWYTLSDREHLFKVAGIIAAGLFFGYRAVTGYHLVDMSLKEASEWRRIPARSKTSRSGTTTLTTVMRSRLEDRGVKRC